MSEDFKAKVKRVFDSYKRKDKDDYFIDLPIYDHEQMRIGKLSPVRCDWQRNNGSITYAMTKWRIENPDFNAGNFTPTVDRTTKWLNESVIDRDDRILFLVESSGCLIGHMGLSSFDYENKTCEVDCVLRGYKNDFPIMMTHAMRSLIRWTKKEINPDFLDLCVFSDNDHAINFYKRLGFAEEYLIPLEKEFVTEKEWRWKKDWSPDSSKTHEKHYLHMRYIDPQMQDDYRKFG